MQKTSKTRILVECALMIALAVVLDILPLPQVAKRRFRFGFHGPDCISLLPSWYKMGTFDRFHLLHRTDDYRILRASRWYGTGFCFMYPAGLCNRLHDFRSGGSFCKTFLE